MPPAPAAVFLELDAVAVVMPVLGRDVVAVLAFGALERHVDAPITGHCSTSFGDRLEAGSVYPATPLTCADCAVARASDGGAGGPTRVREPLQEGRSFGPPVHARGRSKRLDGIVLHRDVLLQRGPHATRPLVVDLGRGDVVAGYGTRGTGRAGRRRRYRGMNPGRGRRWRSTVAGVYDSTDLETSGFEYLVELRSQRVDRALHGVESEAMSERAVAASVFDLGGAPGAVSSHICGFGTTGAGVECEPA